jgi:hypothetical protein
LVSPAPPVISFFLEPLPTKKAMQCCKLEHMRRRWFYDTFSLLLTEDDRL